MAEILIRRHRESVAVCLGTIEQFVVAQDRSASLESRVDVVLPQVSAEGRCCILVKQGPQVADTCKSRRSWSRTLSACQRSTSENQSRNCPTVAPSLRFSNSAATGTPVPQNTHVLLTLSGSRLIPGQVFQFAIRRPRSQCEPCFPGRLRDCLFRGVLSFSHSLQSCSLVQYLCQQPVYLAATPRD